MAKSITQVGTGETNGGPSGVPPVAQVVQTRSNERVLESQFIQVDEQVLHLRLTPPGCRDVVFLHGIPGSGRTWDRLLYHLPSDIGIVVPDLLGFGGSTRPTAAGDLHAEGQAERLAIGLEKAGVERPVLVAHDFGGPVALRLLMRNPDGYAGLVLAATNAFGDTPVPFPLSLVNAPFVGGAFARLLFSRVALAAMCRFGARRGAVNVAASLGDASQSAAIRTIFAASLTNLPGLYGPVERFLPSLQVPTLVVWGTHDPFFAVRQAERTAAAIANARLVVLDGCGHFIPEEAPQELAHLLVSFIGKVTDSPKQISRERA